MRICVSSLIWSQSVLSFLPVWLIFFIVFSIVVSLPKKPHLFRLSFFLLFFFFLFSTVGPSGLFFLFFYTIMWTYSSTLLFLSDYFPFLSSIYFQALFSLFYPPYFLTIPAFCSLSTPPFCHRLHLLLISAGSLPIHFITVWYRQHIPLCDPFAPSHLPSTCAQDSPHVHICLQMFLVALGLWWYKRRSFSRVPTRIWIHMWSVCHSKIHVHPSSAQSIE